MATQAEATLRLYQALNSPAKAGRVWVQYERKTIDAALDVLKQLMTLQGYEFKPEATGKAKAHNVKVRGPEAALSPEAPSRLPGSTS